jgi:hypothetical protein
MASARGIGTPYLSFSPSVSLLFRTSSVT